MNTITFTCETITPMFLAGADGQTPELRAPSIKGAMRFWWRAMNGHLGLDVLKDKEDKIFGGTTQRSKVSIHVEQPNNPTFIKGKKLNEFKLDYFFFTFLHHQISKERDGYIKGTKFKIRFSSRDFQALNEFIKSFWILVYLGGLGTRSRRGLGAFTVKKIETKSEELNKWRAMFKLDNIESALHDVLETKKNNKIPTNFTFSSLHNATIYHSSSGKDMPYEALWLLEDIMTDMRVNEEFTIADLPEKASFGLPIMVRFPKTKPLELNLKNNERRASPVYISTYLDNDAKFRWVVTYLKGEFMQTEDSIVLKRDKNEIRKWKEEDSSLLNKFFEELEKEEVTIKIILK